MVNIMLNLFHWSDLLGINYNLYKVFATANDRALKEVQCSLYNTSMLTEKLNFEVLQAFLTKMFKNFP